MPVRLRSSLSDPRNPPSFCLRYPTLSRPPRTSLLLARAPKCTRTRLHVSLCARVRAPAPSHAKKRFVIPANPTILRRAAPYVAGISDDIASSLRGITRSILIREDYRGRIFARPKPRFTSHQSAPPFIVCLLRITGVTAKRGRVSRIRDTWELLKLQVHSSVDTLLSGILEFYRPIEYSIRVNKMI